MARKRKQCEKLGESGHDGEPSSSINALKGKKQLQGESSKLSVSTPEFERTRRPRCIISESSHEALLSVEEERKRIRNCEAAGTSTPDAEPSRRKRSILPSPESDKGEGSEAQITPLAIAQGTKRSRFSPAVSIPTPSPETVKRRRGSHSRELGHDQEANTPISEIRSTLPSSRRTVAPDHEGNTPTFTDVDYGLGSVTASHSNREIDRVHETEGSEFRDCTPVVEIPGRDAQSGPRTPPLTAEPSRSQKRLFREPSEHEKGERDAAVEDEDVKRGWALDRRRKDFDHGKFTEDELVDLLCGLNKLMEARNWDRDAAVGVLTHSSGRGRPHAEARGAWEEIAKCLPGSSIVRVNMKSRSLLFRGKTGRWDAEETELLKRLVQEHGNDWITISSKLGRSNGACARKWSAIRLDLVRTRTRGKWSQEEYDQLCHHIREAKATRILNPSRKAGNRQVKDNLRWEPIAFKMGRPANQCGLVWYNRLAPSMDREIFLQVEDRQWADEDDRRLLKKMVRLMSVDGEISWSKVFLSDRNCATCKARYRQMTHRRCLGDDLSEAGVEEQLKILVRRYAPDLTFDESRAKRAGAKRRKGMEAEGGSGSRTGIRKTHQRRHEERRERQETEESTREVNTSITFPARDSVTPSKEGNPSAAKRTGKEERGELPVGGNLTTKKGKSRRNEVRDQYGPSESSCFREEEVVGDVEEVGESRERTPQRSRSSADGGRESRLPEKEEIRHRRRKHLRTVVEGSTSKRHLFGGGDERAADLITKRTQDKHFKRDVELYRNCFARNEDFDSLEFQRFDREFVGNVEERRQKKRKLFTVSPNSEKQGRICLQISDDREDSCSENEGSTSMEF